MKYNLNETTYHSQIGWSDFHITEDNEVIEAEHTSGDHIFYGEFHTRGDAQAFIEAKELQEYNYWNWPGKPVECDRCEETFSVRGELSRDPVDDSEEYICPDCELEAEWDNLY